MPDNRFTPGPWAIDGTSPLDSHPAIIIATQDFVIAEVFADTDPTEPEVVANATLIAAAPDLVEAGQYLLDMIEAQGRARTPVPKRESEDDANSRDEHDQVFADAIVRLRAALTKAGVQS